MATIRARYEKGVLRPLEPLDLEEGREVDVYVPVDDEGQEMNGSGEAPSPETAQEVDEMPSEGVIDPFDVDEPPPGMNPTIWRIANLHKQFPGAFDDAPTDLSVNYKHYLYGHPKVSVDE